MWSELCSSRNELLEESLLQSFSSEWCEGLYFQVLQQNSHLLAVELPSASWRVRTLSSAWKEMDLICVARFEINWVYEEILRRFTLRVFLGGYGEREKQIPMIRT